VLPDLKALVAQSIVVFAELPFLAACYMLVVCVCNQRALSALLWLFLCVLLYISVKEFYEYDTALQL
jgi:hypothetical protein